MNVYFDACAIVPLFHPETATPAIGKMVGDDTNTLHISDLSAGEFTSSFSRRYRMGEITALYAQESMAVFDSWAEADCVLVPINNIDIKNAAALVRRFDLKLLMSDAIHAALCIRHDLTLVTLDERLAVACGAIGVNVLVPG